MSSRSALHLDKEDHTTRSEREVAEYKARADSHARAGIEWRSIYPTYKPPKRGLRLDGLTLHEREVAEHKAKERVQEWWEALHEGEVADYKENERVPEYGEAGANERRLDQMETRVPHSHDKKTNGAHKLEWRSIYPTYTPPKRGLTLDEREVLEYQANERRLDKLLKRIHPPHWHGNKLTNDEKNDEAADYYDYNNILWDTPNVKNTPDMKDQKYTHEQYKEWKRIHQHTGHMSVGDRRKIMRRMQKDANKTPEEFHKHVTDQETEFHMHHSRPTYHTRLADHKWHRDRTSPGSRFNV